MRLLLGFICLLISSSSFAQLQGVNSPQLQFAEFKLTYNDIIILIEEGDIGKTFESNVDLYLDLGETVQGVLIEISGCTLKDLIIEQQFETSISIANEGPHLDLLEWKHYTSKWEKITVVEDFKFIALSYSEEEESRFPEFKLQELINYLHLINKSTYADLVEYPKFKDGSVHWRIGLSRISFKITGKDQQNNLITKQVNFDIPMGC